MQVVRMAWMPEPQPGLEAVVAVAEAASNWLHQTSLSLEPCERLAEMEAQLATAGLIMAVPEAVAEAAVTSAFLQLTILPPGRRLPHLVVLVVQQAPTERQAWQAAWDR